MNSEEKQISLKQSFLLYIVLLGSLSITFISSSTVKTAGPAAWISSFVAFGLFIPNLLILQYIFRKYDTESFTDILKDIFGKILGTVISILFIIWFTHYISGYIYNYVLKITMSIFPGENRLVFAAVILLLAAYVLRSDILSIARMNEIFFIIIMLVYMTLNIMMIPSIKLNNLYPITYYDIFPVFKSSLYITGMYCQVLVIFTFCDQIKGKKLIFKNGLKALILLTLLILLVIAIPLGVYGPNLISSMPMPYFSAVKQISIFQALERLEASVVALWILTDFIVILVFSYADFAHDEDTFQTSKIPK